MSDIQFTSSAQRSGALSSLTKPQDDTAPEKQSSAPKSDLTNPVFFSPRIAIDPQTANAVLQVRDTQTGAVISQYPDKVSSVYRDAQAAAETEAANAQKQPAPVAEGTAGEEVSEAATVTASEGDSEVAPVAIDNSGDTSSTAGALGIKQQASSGLTGQSNDNQAPVDQTI